METQPHTQTQIQQPFLTIQQLAARWGMKPWGIRNRVHRGLPMPPSFHFPGGQRRLFKIKDVEKWEEENAIFAPPCMQEEPRRGRPTKREARERRQAAAAQAGGEA